MAETPFVYAIISENDPIGNKRIYNALLVQSLVNRAIAREMPTGDNTIDNLSLHITDWLSKTDFYISPASLKYHDAFEGGLMYHSLCVYNKMLELIKIPSFQHVDIASATLVALTHDWCKIGKYDTYFKNVKDDAGNWQQQLAYKYSEDHMGLGHCTQSLVMLMQFCNTKYTSLTFDEMAAIQWHMYTWDMSDYDKEDMNKCNNNIPLVKLIQFADQLACTQF
jgi:hypothetical protein